MAVESVGDRNTLSRREALAWGGAAAVGALTAPSGVASVQSPPPAPATAMTPATSPTRRPNVLWVCTDSQRWDTLGCYGNRFVRTPNADRLAAEGVLFEQCHVVNPLCMPSRGSFLTGRYPSATRLRANGQASPAGLVPIPRTLRDAGGYVCGLAGKLHLHACDRRFSLGPEWWNTPRETWAYPMEPRGDDGYAEFAWDHAELAPGRASAYNDWLRERGHAFERRKRSDTPYVLDGMPPELSQAKWGTDVAIDFLTRHGAARRPWLFSLNLFDPHYVFDPDPADLERYLAALDEIPLPRCDAGEPETKPAPHLKAFRGGGSYPFPTMTPREHRLVRAAYWALCDNIDRHLGRLLAALDATGQRDNTIVIFTSDHGEMLGDHGLYTKGPYLYDGATRVPLIVRYPGVTKPGLRVASPVELPDLAPTLLAAAGLPKDPGMQAVDLTPVLSGASKAVRDDTYCEYLDANPDDPAIHMTSIRTATHKLVLHHNAPTDAPRGELYDLTTPDAEHNNLFTDPAHAAVKSDLTLRLAARMATAMTDPLPPRVGAY